MAPTKVDCCFLDADLLQNIVIKLISTCAIRREEYANTYILIYQVYGITRITICQP